MQPRRPVYGSVAGIFRTVLINGAQQKLKVETIWLQLFEISRDFNQKRLKQENEDESGENDESCRHTCPPERDLEFSYRSSICEVKAWKSGMTNFFRKA